MQPYSVENNLVLLRNLDSLEIDFTNSARLSDWIQRYDGDDLAEMLEFASKTLVVTLQSLSQQLMDCASHRFDPSCLVSSIRSPAAIIVCPLIEVTHYAEPDADVTLPTISVTDVIDVERELAIVSKLRNPRNHTVVAGFSTAGDVTTLRNRNVRVFVGKTVQLLDSKLLTRSEHGQVMGFTGKERNILRSYAVGAIPAVASLHLFPVIQVEGDAVIFATGTQGDMETTKQQYRNIFNKT
jgi:hypothetical protein